MTNLMKPPIQDSFAPASEKAFAEFEAASGIKLPDDYKTLLKRRNGGFFKHFVEFGDGLSVSTLFALDAPFEYADLLASFTDFCTNQAGENRFLPIGDDGLGNNILINWQQGGVFLWDHENGVEKQIATGLGEFLDGIRYSDEQQRLWTETLPLFVAAERGDVNTLREHLPQELDQRNHLGKTLLGCASASRQPYVVKELVSLGAATDDRMPDGKTPLTYAALGSAFEISETLIANGASLDTQDEDGVTPLIAALSNGAIRVAMLLIESGADIHISDKFGNNPRTLCITGSSKRYVMPLLDE